MNFLRLTYFTSDASRYIMVRGTCTLENRKMFWKTLAARACFFLKFMRRVVKTKNTSFLTFFAKQAFMFKIFLQRFSL